MQIINTIWSVGGVLYQVATESPFLLISNLIKAVLFANAFVNVCAAILIPLGLRGIIELVNNKVVKVCSVVLCFVIQIWTNSSVHLTYFCGFYLGCYVCESCWYVSKHFQKEVEPSQQMKCMFFMTIWLFGLAFSLFFMIKISKAIQEESIFIYLFGELLVVMVIAFIRVKSIFFMVIVFSVVGLTTLLRHYFQTLKQSYPPLSLLNFPFEAMLFNMLATNGRYKEREVERDRDKKQFKDRVFEAVVMFFVYGLMTGRTPRYEHAMFLISLYYLIFKKV